MIKANLPIGSTCPICRGAGTVWSQGKPVKCTWCDAKGMMTANKAKSGNAM